ncbi:MAG: glycosyltransferase family 1 protein [Chitinophagaceae bacterium]
MLSTQLEGNGNFIYETFTRIAKQHPAHEFIFIFDQPFDEAFITNENITPVVAGPAARYPLLWKYWYDIKIPAVLKKYKADVFVSTDGFCSLKTKVPQCLIMHDLAFLYQPLYIKKSHAAWLKKTTPKFLSKAKAIVATTNFLKQELIEKFAANTSKIDVVYCGVSELYQPLLADEKILIKNKYTDGKEYFIYTGLIDVDKNLLNLLKAFSVFKKRQQTSMKLVLAGRVATKYESFKKNLQSYKYRNDVVLMEQLTEAELVNVVGAAYGFIYPSLIEALTVPVIEAMKCDVPVIAAETNSMKEIVKDAAVFVDGTNHIAMAEQMMLLYKDEKLRNDLIIKGRKVAVAYRWDTTANLLWKSIEKAIG